MPNLELVEYWSGVGDGYQLSGNTFTFNPKPISLTKDVSVKWRIRRPGYQRKIERARFRYNEKISFKVTGSCSQSKRNEIEWYTKRDALFKLVNCDMLTIPAQETSDADYGASENAKRYWSYAKDFNYGEGASAGAPVYVVFESAKFSQKEGKVDWFDYIVTLRRVHLTRH